MKRISTRRLISKLREIALISMLAFCLHIVWVSVGESSDRASTLTKDFFMQNGYYDTGAKNIIAAIYLDYRLLDSVFESSLLLVTIAGVLHISKSDDYID